MAKEKFEYNKNESIQPVQKTIGGKRMVAIAGTGLFEIDKQKDREEERRKTEDNNNLKNINTALKSGVMGGKGKDGDNESKSKLGAFAGSLGGSAKEGIVDAVAPLVDMVNPMTYIKMLGSIPGVSAVGDAINASRKIKSSEDKNEDKEDDKVEDKQTDTGYKILENDEHNKSSLESMDGDFDKLLNLTETIKETLFSIMNQGLDDKLSDKENRNESKRMMAGVPVGTAAGIGIGGGGGEDGESDTGNSLIDMTKDAANSNWLTNLLLGGGVIKTLAKRIPGASLLMRGLSRSKSLLGTGLLKAKNLIPGLGGATSLIGKNPLPMAGGQGVLTSSASSLKNPINLVDDVAKNATKLSKARQAGLAVRSAASKLKHLKHLAKINPAGALLIAGEIGTESWIRQTEAHTAGLEESLGKGFRRTEKDPGLVIDKETGMVEEDKSAWMDALKNKGIDPTSNKAGQLRRRMNGANSLKINEQLINDSIREAHTLRNQGEDQEANKKIQKAVELLKARKTIVGNMAFTDHKDAMKAYTLNFSDIGRKLSGLRGTFKWSEWEDWGHMTDLTDAFEQIDKGALRVGLDAREKELRIQESKTQKKILMTDDGPVFINTSPNTSGGILSETNTQLQNNRASMGNGQVTSNQNLGINNSNTSNTTNNNTVTGRGDSRMDEPAFNSERNNMNSRQQF